MEEEKKAVKQRKTVTLKPINIKWIAERALEESTPEDRVSDSELIDRLIDKARAQFDELDKIGREAKSTSRPRKKRTLKSE